MRRLVICAGIRRSGSTWLFNTVRLALYQDLEYALGSQLMDWLKRWGYT